MKTILEKIEAAFDRMPSFFRASDAKRQILDILRSHPGLWLEEISQDDAMEYVLSSRVFMMRGGVMIQAEVSSVYGSLPTDRFYRLPKPESEEK